MSDEKKRIAADRLLDEIGNIDDRFIYEAGTPYRKKGATIRRFVIIAVAATLSLCLLIGSLSIGGLAILFFGDMKLDGTASNSTPDGNVNADVGDSTGNAPASLDERFEALRTSENHYKSTSEDTIIRDGRVKVIWKYSDEDYYRYAYITDREAMSLVSKLRQNNGKRFEGDPTDTVAQIWICMEDGRIISPYLALSAGNVGYGELFDYLPEYEPSKNFSDYLCEIIS